jgi:hypothetical protein
MVVAFNHEVDASLVNDTTVSLERIAAGQGNSATGAVGASAPATMGSMDSAAPGGEPTARLRISAALAQGNPAAIVITPTTTLGAGTYRVTMRGTGGGALADVNAQALGLDHSIVFTVDLSQ